MQLLPIFKPRRGDIIIVHTLKNDFKPRRGDIMITSFGKALFHCLPTGHTHFYAFYFWLNPIRQARCRPPPDRIARCALRNQPKNLFRIIVLADALYRCMLRSAVGDSIPPCAGLRILTMLLQLPPEAVLCF